MHYPSSILSVQPVHYALIPNFHSFNMRLWTNLGSGPVQSASCAILLGPFPEPSTTLSIAISLHSLQTVPVCYVLEFFIAQHDPQRCYPSSQPSYSSPLANTVAWLRGWIIVRQWSILGIDKLLWYCESHLGDFVWFMTSVYYSTLWIEIIAVI